MDVPLCSIEEIDIPEHHVQQELCKTRPRYRQGRELTAVKAYTVNNESQHLLFYNVPALNLSTELRDLCGKYGEISRLEEVKDYKLEEFTECYHLTYKRIQSARIAKRFLDNKSFYGGILHVCYAPEFETRNQVKQKLEQRLRDVALRNAQHGPTQIEYIEGPEASKGPTPEQPNITNRKRSYDIALSTQNHTIIGPVQLNSSSVDDDFKSIGKRKKIINLPKLEEMNKPLEIKPPTKVVEKRIVFHKKNVINSLK